MAHNALIERKKIAILGSGVSGLSAFWLLSKTHDVTLFEQGDYAGGHSNTVEVGDNQPVAVDTGFIVYNEQAYPNLTRLFQTLGVATKPTEMTFAVSTGGGALQYAGNDLFTLFAQKKNLFSRRFWSMLLDIKRFYAEAPGHIEKMAGVTLGTTSTPTAMALPFGRITSIQWRPRFGPFLRGR